ncbi:MAG: roadblock/LC7 domain-containing protein [Candidatus Hodarchaeota archaeon]
MSKKIDRLTEILKKLEQDSGVNGAAIVSSKGQIMCAALHQDVDEKAIGAMSAAISTIGNRVGQVLKAGEIASVVLNGSQAVVILNQLSEAVLIATAPADAKIGLIDFEIANAIKKIEEIL